MREAITFKYIGDKEKTITKAVRDNKGNIRELRKIPDNSPDPAVTSFFGIECRLNEAATLSPDNKLYDHILSKLKANHHFEIVNDTNRAKKQSAKKTKSSRSG